jgi:hypothetical protein
VATVATPLAKLHPWVAVAWAPSKVSELLMLPLQEPDPRRPPDPSPAMNNPYAGRSSCSKNISFGTNGAIDPIKYTEHSGKRGASTVFEEVRIMKKNSERRILRIEILLAGKK